MKAHNVRVYLRTRGLLALGDHHCLFPNLAIDEQGYSSVQLCTGCQGHNRLLCRKAHILQLLQPKWRKVGRQWYRR